jgi:hypothetical protein
MPACQTGIQNWAFVEKSLIYPFAILLMCSIHAVRGAGPAEMAYRLHNACTVAAALPCSTVLASAAALLLPQRKPDCTAGKYTLG